MIGAKPSAGRSSGVGAAAHGVGQGAVELVEDGRPLGRGAPLPPSPAARTRSASVSAARSIRSARSGRGSSRPSRRASSTFS